jgi:hypothetical protein
MNDRFIVKENTPNSFMIYDKGVSGELEVKALPIYFASVIDIYKICRLMNDEWFRFLNRPS